MSDMSPIADDRRMSDNASLVIVVCGISVTITAVVFIVSRAAVEALRVAKGSGDPESRTRR